ncbi:MAG: carboxypeptidase regulatory-like domain-containing protein, partial [Desulfurococcales archaeon]|nr:carboxypeptidase regulatory-like domain-containing protein [Desulfurococcales archaeon]
AQTFVSKVLTYEKNPPLEDYPLSMLFMAYDTDSQTHSEVCKEDIDNLYVPFRFDPITKLYESNGGWGRVNAINALNVGYNIINHIDHANWNCMGVGYFNHGANLYSSDMDALTNESKQSVLYSVGCWAAAFDHNAVSEHFVNNPNGGGVAFIGNSRYGWYIVGNPGNGPSDLYDKMFFQSLFWDNACQIGFTNASAKVYYIGSCQSYNVMRWCQFVLNVLGPTEMPIWTVVPDTLDVDHPSLIPFEPGEFIVTVTSKGISVENALVCVTGSDIYEYEYTNADGQAVLFVSPTTPGDTIQVTVTHHYYLPYEGFTLVLSQRPYVTYLRHSISDTTYGNGNGMVNPGESIEMPLWVKNIGNVAADSVFGVLTTTDPYIIDISDSVKSFGHIEPEDSSFTGSDGYNFTVLGNCHNAHCITFDLICNDVLDSIWISYLSVMVAAPVLSFVSYSVIDSMSGNCNGVPEPGEVFDMTVSITNSGLATAEDVHAILSTDDPFITINLDSASFVNIEPCDTVISTPYNIYIDPSCPDPHNPIFTLEIIGNNYTTMDSFSIFTGIPGFFDDMENSDPGWTHYSITPGYHDQWHISQARSHSLTHSRKCGDDLSGNYMNYDDAGLVTPPIILAPNSCLKFWHWIGAEAYPVIGAKDGAIVEISADEGNTWQQITPVEGYPYTISPGSDGPFPDDTPCFSGLHDWQRVVFYLTEYLGVVQFRFRFGSDGYITHEGWYIDDVSVDIIELPVIEGTVTEAEKGPIEGAIVTAQSSFNYCDTTDVAGHYFMEVFPDTYDMTVNAFGYNQFDTTGIVVLPCETTVVNFALQHPEIVVVPASFEIELPVDTTYITTMTIINIGNGTLDFNVSIGEDNKFVKSIEINPDGIGKIPSHRISSIQRDDISPFQHGKLHDLAPEVIKEDDFLNMFQLAPDSENSDLETKQEFQRHSPFEETIHYDGENSGGIGPSCGCLFEGAIRLTPYELEPYDGWKLISVLFYHSTSNTYSGQIKIYSAGTSTEPGALITSEPYDVNEPTWLRTDLTESVTIDATQDLWTSVEIAGSYPLGVDAGPAVQGKGDFVCVNGGWFEFYLAGIDRNLNIRAIVAPNLLYVTPYSGMVTAGQSLDLIVHFDTHELAPDSTYTTNILIYNNSVDSLVTIPVTIHTTS